MLDYDVVAQGMLRLTNWFAKFGLWDCGMASSMEASFEESYEVRAMLHAEKVLGLGHIQDVAHSFCDLMLGLQGVHEENMYDMGYGYDRDREGRVNCSCVADCCSVAGAIVETVNAYPDYPKNVNYLESVRKFIDHVLRNYVTDYGVIGVGILNHKINPMPEYWCANGLFSQVLVSFGELTGETVYLDAAVAPLEFLALFDYRDTEWKEWNISPQMMILYSGEGIVAGLASEEMKKRLDILPKGVIKKSLEDNGAENDEGLRQAANRVKADVDIPKRDLTAGELTVYGLLRLRWDEYIDWLYKNQGANGLWKSPSDQSYRDYETGLSWLISRAGESSGTCRNMERAVERQLSYLTSQDAKSYFGLFCRPFSTALAHLSFAYISEKLMEKDPEGFERALRNAAKNAFNYLW